MCQDSINATLKKEWSSSNCQNTGGTPENPLLTHITAIIFTYLMFNTHFLIPKVSFEEK